MQAAAISAERSIYRTLGLHSRLTAMTVRAGRMMPKVMVSERCVMLRYPAEKLKQR